MLIRNALLCSVLLLFACNKKTSGPCSESKNLGVLELTTEAFESIPYDYEAGDRFVFKNEQGEELIFFPSTEAIVDGNIAKAFTLTCTGGESSQIDYKSNQRILVYQSNGGVSFFLSLETKIDENQEDLDGYQAYDEFYMAVYNSEIEGDDFLFGHHLTIPVSFRGNPEFEPFSQFRYWNYEENFSIRDMAFQDVYFSGPADSPKVAYSPQHGMVAFTDHEDKLWVFDRTQALNTEEAFNFTLPTPDQTTLSLSEIEGELIILDFWASWCVPCRTEIEETLKPLYAEYKDKGLEIVSISLDEDYNDWLQALEEDDMDWQQVIDLQGFQSDLLIYYVVYGIPTVYVLDAEKKIMSPNSRGEELSLLVSYWLD